MNELRKSRIPFDLPSFLPSFKPKFHFTGYKTVRSFANFLRSIRVWSREERQRQREKERKRENDAMIPISLFSSFRSPIWFEFLFLILNLLETSFSFVSSNLREREREREQREFPDKILNWNEVNYNEEGKRRGRHSSMRTWCLGGKEGGRLTRARKASRVPRKDSSWALRDQMCYAGWRERKNSFDAIPPRPFQGSCEQGGFTYIVRGVRRCFLINSCLVKPGSPPRGGFLVSWTTRTFS